MNSVRVVTACLMTMLAGAGSLSAEPPARPRFHGLVLKVLSSAGVPISNARIVCYQGGLTPGIVRETDATGECTFILPVTDHVSRVCIGPDLLSAAMEVIAGNAARSQSRILENYGWSGRYWVDVPAGSETHAVSLSIADAVSVSGTCVGTEDTGALFVGRVSGGVMVPCSPSDGAFAVKGVPKGAAGQLVIIPERSPRWTLVPLAAELLIADANVGAAVPLVETGAAEVRLTLTNGGALPLLPTADSTSITLTSEDGSRVYVYDTLGVTSLVLDASGKREHRPPVAGTYFVSSGTLVHGGGEQVLLALRAGHAGLLRTAGVPEIVVPETGTVAKTVDLLAAWNAMNTAVPESP